VLPLKLHIKNNGGTVWKISKGAKRGGGHRGGDGGKFWGQGKEAIVGGFPRRVPRAEILYRKGRRFLMFHIEKNFPGAETGWAIDIMGNVEGTGGIGGGKKEKTARDSGKRSYLLRGGGWANLSLENGRITFFLL